MRARLLSALQELAQGDDAASPGISAGALDWTRSLRDPPWRCRRLYGRVGHRARAVSLSRPSTGGSGVDRACATRRGSAFAPTLLGSSDRVRAGCVGCTSPQCWCVKSMRSSAEWEWLVDELATFPARKLLLQFLQSVRVVELCGGDEAAAFARASNRCASWVMRTRWPGCGRRKSSRRCRNCGSLGDYPLRRVSGAEMTCATLAAIGRRRPGRDFLAACHWC